MTFSVPEDKGNILREAFSESNYIRILTTAALKVIPENQFENCSEG
jgi:hypothetical protein